jgi:hypothetical protein|tara:strand:- start:159 stop:338 length:180 start_codon:yes stop_codon:yes gene_type:complete
MRGAQKSLVLLIIWAHLWVGLYFWLRIKDWYQNWFIVIYAFVVVTPILSLLGLPVSPGD